MRRSKRKRSDKEDWLSYLPEDVLCHILSYLETKDAFRTSILSRSWRSLWTLVPDVSFDRYDDEDFAPGFVRFVDKVLDLRKPLGIRKFNLHICCSSEFQFHHFNAWIRGAIDCRAKELDITVEFPCLAPRDSIIVLPLSVLTSETLTTLKMAGNLLFSPSFAWLPSLKILNLDMYYHCDELVPILVSSCPSLEELYIGGMYKALEIRAPRLKKLSANFQCSGATRMEIDAPSLEYLSLDEAGSPNYVIKNLDNIMEAQLSMPVRWRERGSLFDLFGGLSNVKSLYLSILIIKHNRHKDYDDPLDEEYDGDPTGINISRPRNCLPEFPNLVRLRLDGFCELELLPGFLQKSPKLEVLVVERRCTGDAFWTKPQEAPRCLSSSLTHFTYKGFSAEKQEFECVKYILRKSSVLKTLTIQPAFSLITAKSRKEIRRICRKLSRLPRGSKSCEFVFDTKPFHPDKGLQSQYHFNCCTYEVVRRGSVY